MSLAEICNPVDILCYFIKVLFTYRFVGSKGWYIEKKMMFKNLLLFGIFCLANGSPVERSITVDKILKNKSLKDIPLEDKLLQDIILTDSLSKDNSIKDNKLEACTTRECIGASYRILKSMNESVDPCDNFFQVTDYSDHLNGSVYLEVF